MTREQMIVRLAINAVQTAAMVGAHCPLDEMEDHYNKFSTEELMKAMETEL